MGEACNLGDKPGGPFKYPTSDEHIAEMQEVVREAVAAGALFLRRATHLYRIQQR